MQVVLVQPTTQPGRQPCADLVHAAAASAPGSGSSTGGGWGAGQARAPARARGVGARSSLLRAASGSSPPDLGSSDAAGATPEQPRSSSGGGGDPDPPPPSPGVRAALAALRFYKEALSPLMQSTCRFLPTCSSYSMAAYTQHGVARGTVLTAWRLLRCNPWGGRGYDPPAWPPVGLEAAFDSFAYSAEVACVVGGGLVAWLVQATVADLTS